MADDKKSDRTKELEVEAKQSHIDDLEKNQEKTNDDNQKEIDKEKEELSDMQNS